MIGCNPEQGNSSDQLKNHYRAVVEINCFVKGKDADKKISGEGEQERKETTALFLTDLAEEPKPAE